MAAKHSWYNRPILSQDHIPELERSAALLEFGHGMHREDAEKHAYANYKVQHHQHAAAHHLRGLKAAQAAGDIEEAQKHGVAYSLHMENLGHDPMEAVPPNIRALAEAEDKPKAYKFKSHAGDALILPKQQ
jgi:hypothetical protein